MQEEHVKLWLKELKDVSYDAEDMLDETLDELPRALVGSAGTQLNLYFMASLGS